MSKENLEKLMKEAAVNPELAKKLMALEQQYVAQITALAKEMGFSINPEDFREEVQSLSDEALAAAAGGWSPLAEMDMLGIF